MLNFINTKSHAIKISFERQQNGSVIKDKMATQAWWLEFNAQSHVKAEDANWLHNFIFWLHKPVVAHTHPLQHSDKFYFKFPEILSFLLPNTQ